ncbi:MAG: Hpt domain-containing protein [Ruminococcus sp.]|nr:Hpt domain-containing protein [Ruminococcus sp.]
MNRDLLISGGIDYDHGVERFMNNASVYEKLLRNFPNDNLYEKAFEDYEKGDMDAVFRSLHTMKSTAGTLDMTSLYNATHDMVEAIRSAQLKGTDALMDKIKACYKAAVDAINNA